MQKQTDRKRTETPFEPEDCLVHRRPLQLPAEEFCTEDNILYFSLGTMILRFVLFCFLLGSNLLIFIIIIIIFLLKISLIPWTMPFHPIF